jgi:phosphatidylserine decarboxylase
METDKRLRLPVAHDGLKFVLPLLGVAIVSLLFGVQTVAGIAAVLAGFVLFFFRDPNRKPPAIVGAIVSPADGRVSKIEEVDHDKFPGGRARRVSVFLSLFNVHVNRSPVDARVEDVEYRPGRFHNAMSDASARENERNTIRFRNGTCQVVVDQIAGIIARRVVCNCQAGDLVSRGQRIGLIRFGSRCDTYFPLDADVRVRKGMKVVGGESVLAILPEKSVGAE